MIMNVFPISVDNSVIYSSIPITLVEITTVKSRHDLPECDEKYYAEWPYDNRFTGNPVTGGDPPLDA
jgi:hypothetical protein